MHLQVKKPQNGRMKVFTDKQGTTKISLIFLNVKTLQKCNNTGLRSCNPTGKVDRTY